MKKLFFTLLMLVPMTLWAQDNTWERPEVDEQAEAAKAKENPDAKYLKGAVPEVNGKVVFTKHINAPGKSAAQIYDILHQYLQKMVKEKNQLENSKLITEDTQKHELVASFEEWLVFKSRSWWPASKSGWYSRRGHWYWTRRVSTMPSRLNVRMVAWM